MDPSRFDVLARRLAGSGTRRDVLAALAGGVALPLVAGAGEVAGKKHKKKCKNGLKRCNKACVDSNTDSANCGKCGNVCSQTTTCGGGNPVTPGVCGCLPTGTVTTFDNAHAGACCSGPSCCAEEGLPDGHCRCATGCG